MPVHRARRGFTLAETMLAVSILTVAILAIVQAVTAGHFQSRQAAHSARATSLTEAMVERILALPYDDPDTGVTTPGPEPGETSAADFDNADDFHGYVESSGQLTDAAGNAYPAGYQGFQRSVTAVYGPLNVPGLGGERLGLRIKVVVRDPNGRVWGVQRFMPQPTESGG